MPEKRPPVTAKDIARECGVSQATVSYVVNSAPGKNISEKTRRLVLETADRMNYFPNSAARVMRTRLSRSIGVVVGRNNINIGFNQVLRGAKRVFDAAGYTVTLLQDEHVSSGCPEYISYYRSSRIDGVMFSFCEPDSRLEEDLSGNGIPFVSVNESGVHLGGGTRHDALRRAVGECAELCREKGLGGVRFLSFAYGEKMHSLKYDLLAAAVAELFPSAVLTRSVIQAEGKENVELFEDICGLIGAGGFDVAVTPNQHLGILVQSAIMRSRLAYPQEPKHICLDAAYFFRTLHPSVTSLEIPLEEIGCCGAGQLLNIVSGLPFEEKNFRCALKPGGSTE